MDIYEEHENNRELERKIKLKDWVQFKNEGKNNVYNKDSERQNSRLIFSIISFLVSLVWIFVGINYFLRKDNYVPDVEGDNWQVGVELLIASIFAIISFISASKLLHYKLTDVWYRRDAIVMNVDYLGVKSKYARFKFLIMNKDEAFEEIEIDIARESILCPINKFDRVFLGKPIRNGSDIYIMSNVDDEKRKMDNLQAFNLIKRR